MCYLILEKGRFLSAAGALVYTQLRPVISRQSVRRPQGHRRKRRFRQGHSRNSELFIVITEYKEKLTDSPLLSKQRYLWNWAEPSKKARWNGISVGKNLVCGLHVWLRATQQQFCAWSNGLVLSLGHSNPWDAEQASNQTMLGPFERISVRWLHDCRYGYAQNETVYCTRPEKVQPKSRTTRQKTAASDFTFPPEWLLRRGLCAWSVSRHKLRPCCVHFSGGLWCESDCLSQHEWCSC